MIPVHLNQITAIQLAKGGEVTTCRPHAYHKLHAWRTGVHYGPTTIVAAPGYSTGCGAPTQVVSPKPAHCTPPPAVDRTEVETLAAGVSAGLLRAPSSVFSPAAWSSPFAYRSSRFPKSAVVVLSTFAATSPQAIQVRNALRGYLGANVTISIIVLVPGTPAVVLAFQAPDNYVADELKIACMSMGIQTQVQWNVTAGGNPRPSPFNPITGVAPLDVQAARGQTVAVNAILPATDSFAVGCEVLLNGWTFPSSQATDGTYSKTLRASPGWPRERFN